MRHSRPAPLLTTAAVVAALTVSAVSATAAVEPGGAPTSRAEQPTGRGAEARRDAAQDPLTDLDPEALLPRARGPLQMPRSYPFQPELRIYPDNQPDASDSSGVIPHDEIAPQLMEWMAASDRISTQVVGRSTQGRDLYLVTITAPETRRQTSLQSAWRRKIRETPGRAAADQRLQRDYKLPIWFSANIHGNEWEGTDAAMAVIEDLVEAPFGQVRTLLRSHRLYFSLTLNPDGRTLGTRATALGLNENRDMITNTTPESDSFVRTTAALQPLVAADLHGYTDVLQVEPCGPPHGDNYEYDLFIPHGYAMARQVEDDVVAADIPGNTYLNVETGEVVEENTGPETAHIRIPYRDIPSGWDDYPPIFTAQYAAFFGAVTSTVELPIGRTGTDTQSPENAAVNVAVGKRTIESIVDYAAANGGALLDNQIEMFRRGVVGRPKDALTRADVAAVPGPDAWKPLWDVADDQEPVRLPRAYVIPAGARQRSAGDAADLVRQLLSHRVEVRVLRQARAIGGTTYPAGSYVVDLQQPLRGLANVLLDLGSDISRKVPEMYDISAWSLANLWGATVDKAGSIRDRLEHRGQRVRAPRRLFDMPSGRGPTSFEVAGVSDVRALNALLERRRRVWYLTDGSVVLGPRSSGAVRAVARIHDIDVDRATRAQLQALDDVNTKRLSDLTVAYSGTQDDTLSLTELGFDDLVPVNAETLTADPALLDAADVLWIGSSLEFGAGQGAGRAAVQAFVDSGRSVVGAGIGAYRAASAVGLVSATAVQGNGLGNGIVDVDVPSGSVLAPSAQDTSFVYPAVSFRQLGPGTSVEQSYAAGDPLLAGHWPTTNATDGPRSAGGRASAISGEDASGAKGFVFGTSVFFRNHPKGLLSEAARALYWAAP